MVSKTSWGGVRAGRRSGALRGGAPQAAEVLEGRQLLSAADVAGFTDTSAWRIGGSDESGFEFATVQQWSRSVEWYDPVTGDFDGDGTTDVAARTQFGEWWVGLNDGAGGLTTGLWTQWDPSKMWIEALVGDFDGDGDDDIAGLTKSRFIALPGQASESLFSGSSVSSGSSGSSSGSPSGSPYVDPEGRVVFTGGTRDWWVALSDGRDGFVNRLWGTWTSNTGWQEIGVGDFNDDGRDDIAGISHGAAGIWGSRTSSQGSSTSSGGVRLVQQQWWVALSDGGARFRSELWATWDTTAGWRDIVFGDFDGDGRDDVAGRTDTGQWWVGLSRAPGRFESQAWTVWDESQQWRDVVVGDFDGDGNDDIAGLTRSGQWWVARSTADSRFMNGLWGTWDRASDWRNVAVGDFNDDGRDDIAARRWTPIPGQQALEPKEWWVAKSTSGLAFASELWAADTSIYERVLAGEFDTERD